MSVKIISRPFIIGAAATAVAAGLGGYVWKEQHRPPVLEIYVFALKSGRSVFIRTPEDRRILIDGGGDSSIIRELSGILPFYSRRIDTIVSTGTDGKNAAGLINVIDRYAVDRAFIPGITSTSLGLASSTDGIYFAFVDTLHQKKIAVHEAMAGDRIDLGASTSADVLFPVPAEAFKYSNASGPELLIRISYASTSALFLGDATKKIQKFIAIRASSTADVLYVSQSAAPADMSAELMDALQPEFLVYSKALVNPSAKPGKSSAASAKSATSSEAVASSKKKSAAKMPQDPLASIPADTRLNLKERGRVKLVSDGVSFKVGQ